MSDDLIDELAKDGVYDVSISPEADRTRSAVAALRDYICGRWDNIIGAIDALEWLVAEYRIEDEDYRPRYQDEYQRLWHEARAEVKRLEGQLADTDYALAKVERLEAILYPPLLSEQEATDDRQAG
jgi:hypothetical protein